MYHIFADVAQTTDQGKTLHITGGDYHHIVRVLRMKEGDELSVSFRGDEVPAITASSRVSEEQPEAEGRAEYRYGIEHITGDTVVCTLRFVKRDTAELPVRLILLQGLPKGDKMEQIIEKNTELGIAEIVPVTLKRCVVKLDGKKAVSRVERWNKIAEAAAKQARRGVIPRVTNVMSFPEALAYVRDADLKLLPYELECVEEGETAEGKTGMKRTRELMERAQPGRTVVFFIGPEGGFEEKEVQTAREAGFEPVTLGGRILRTETAGFTVTAWFAYRF